MSKLNKTTIKNMNYNEMRGAAKAQGISSKGLKKADLQAALIASLNGPKRPRGRPVKVADDLFIKTWQASEDRTDFLTRLGMYDGKSEKEIDAAMSWASVRAYHLRNGCVNPKTKLPTREPVNLKRFPRGARKQESTEATES